MPVDNNPREVCEALEYTKLEQDTIIKQYSENKQQIKFLEINRNLWAEMKDLIQELEDNNWVNHPESRAKR